MDWRVPLSDLDYGEEEEAAVLEVLRSRWLTMGAKTQEFEAKFAQRVGVGHAIAVSNATVALHLACVLLEIGPGDEVILPSLTFVATANAVRYTGAKPVFADVIGESELNISPAAIEAKISPKTRAIIVVHYGGFACRMTPIKSLAQRHNLAVIEDAAHAPGASLQGISLGTWGDLGCFSFFSNKNMATGEGGMLVTNDDELAARARRLRSHGMTSMTLDRHKGHAFSYDVTELGFNYRIDEVRSALGLVQLAKLEAGNRRRQELTHHYWRLLEDSGLILPFLDSIGESSYHIMPVLLPDGINRHEFMATLRAAGVQSSIHYPPIHQFSDFIAEHADLDLPNTIEIGARQVTLPLHPGMSDSQVEYVVRAIGDAIQATNG
jgi:dTDP-4-amino-4,6-dideoxygalactose transaminase